MEERRTVHPGGTGSSPVRVACSASALRVMPGWCSEQHRGVRSPNRQFESDLGCHLAVDQRNRALPSEGRSRPLESDRRDPRVGRGCWSGRRPVSKSGGGREAPEFEPSTFRPATSTARSSSGRTAALTQRTQVRVLHGSPTAGAAHPGPSCRPPGPRWTTHKESRHASPPGHDVIQCAQCEVAQR
jgi:hypothetical protein